ncbi:MAG: phenylalanine--tRNA ligase subunit beta [Desulfurococcales archaeon]|nr:phenylalanine--tRNA ligase subunit beta [Desulfurococcales archaeon]
MPVIRVELERLKSLTGLGEEELQDALFMLKCETEITEDGEIAVEVNPDRPDMFIGEGIARAVKGLLGKEKGWKPPTLVDSGLEITVSRVPTRPFIAGIVAYDLNVDDTFLRELIQFQEKLHEGLGRDRRKLAIGLHDLDKLPSKDIRYRMSGLNTVFKPLGSPRAMSGAEILEKTEQGVKYGSISLQGSLHPFLYSGDQVIAMPPVINSDITRVEPGTRSVFIDVTGTDLELVLRVADLIASTLAEREGSRIASVKVHGINGVERTPTMETRVVSLDVGQASKLVGIGLGVDECIELLRKARFEAYPSTIEGAVEVKIPPFRLDIINYVDLVEEIAMMIGYDRLEPSTSKRIMKGSLLRETLLSRKLRDLLVGLGFTETMQLTLTSPHLAKLLGGPRYVEVANPVQAEYSVLRTTITGSLLLVLARSQHRAKPVKIFEIGKVAYIEEGRVLEDLRLGIAYLDEEVSYEDVQAPIYAILRLLGVSYNVDEWPSPYLIQGRSSRIVVGGEPIGWMGEVQPRVLEAMGIEYPVAVAEVSIERLSSSLRT